MRPASEVERRRLNDLFAELCAIPSAFGNERACADRVSTWTVAPSARATCAARCADAPKP